jgi:uncharacterized protein (TIGR00255 family)
MIKSMTGFGTARRANERLEAVVEVKSLNSKSLDTNFRLPRSFSDKELEVRNILNQVLERGKINVNIELQSIGEKKNKLNINRPLAKTYFEELQSLAAEVGASQQDIFRLVLQMPDIYNQEDNTEEKEQDWQIIKQALQEAAQACNEFRVTEGKELASNLTSYIDKIRGLLEQVAVHDPQRMDNIRNRITSHIGEVTADEHFDKNRFEQEMIYYIEKLDISEEKVRLRVHLDYFTEVLTKEESPGKKLNFISQEIGREINTIGSKANDAQIQRYVIDMKEELEKIKEQSLNIL